MTSIRGPLDTDQPSGRDGTTASARHKGVGEELFSADRSRCPIDCFKAGEMVMSWAAKQCKSPTNALRHARIRRGALSHFRAFGQGCSGKDGNNMLLLFDRIETWLRALIRSTASFRIKHRPNRAWAGPGAAIKRSHRSPVLPPRAKHSARVADGSVWPARLARGN